MAGQPQSKSSEIIDKIAALSDRGDATQMEVFRLKREIDSLAGDSAVRFMLLGMLGAAARDVPSVAKNFEAALKHHSDIVILMNYVAALRRVAQFVEGVAVARRAFERYSASPAAYECLLSSMVHSGDFDGFEEATERFLASYPDYNLDESQHFAQVLEVRGNLEWLGVDLSIFKRAMACAAETLVQSACFPWASSITVVKEDGFAYLCVDFKVPGLSEDDFIRVNDAIADRMADAEDPSALSSLVFMVSTEDRGWERDVEVA